MKTLLRIDSSVRPDGSYSRQLTDRFQEQWLRENPGGRVVQRDLAREPVPHLNHATVAAFLSGKDESLAETVLSDQLIGELEAADAVVVGCPVYNFAPPSTLKAWIDHVVRHGRTFTMNGEGTRGLLGGRSACVLIAQGASDPEDGTENVPARYLKSIFQFIGFEKVASVALTGTVQPEPDRSRLLARAMTGIDRLFAQDEAPIWRGDFSAEDRAQIEELRAGQIRAIETGDAKAYAELCVDDVQLLVPGHEVVSGRRAFLDAEERIFQEGRFSSFQKQPLQVERSGELAIESGNQEVTTTPRDGHPTNVFAQHQKYLHVFRKTSLGWRFSMLMSNPRR